MRTVTNDELKARGVSVLETRLKEDEEIVISVKGNDRHVLMSVETYARLREYELAFALQEAKADVEAGRCSVESVMDHMKCVE
ncbi:MAG: type II toxin-antitoxin system Phd/YefM family antitoxin [Pontibacterium sp.]